MPVSPSDHGSLENRGSQNISARLHSRPCPAVAPAAVSNHCRATVGLLALRRHRSLHGPAAPGRQQCPALQHRRCCCTCGGDGTDVMSGMSRVVSYALCSGAGLAARRALMVWCGRHRSQETRRRRRIRTSTAQQWSPYGGSSALGH